MTESGVFSKQVILHLEWIDFNNMRPHERGSCILPLFVVRLRKYLIGRINLFDKFKPNNYVCTGTVQGLILSQWYKVQQFNNSQKTKVNKL